MDIIKSHGAPTITTVGHVGQRYFDIDTETKYVCVDILRREDYEDGPSIHNDFVTTTVLKEIRNEYIWEQIAGGSGGSAGGSGGGLDYDVVIKFGLAIGDDFATVEKGSYQAIADKLNAGESVRVAIVGTWDMMKICYSPEFINFYENESDSVYFRSVSVPGYTDIQFILTSDNRVGIKVGGDFTNGIPI